jgi:hypothetical protein
MHWLAKLTLSIYFLLVALCFVDCFSPLANLRVLRNSQGATEDSSFVQGTQKQQQEQGQENRRIQKH